MLKTNVFTKVKKGLSHTYPPTHPPTHAHTVLKLEKVGFQNIEEPYWNGGLFNETGDCNHLIKNIIWFF